MPFVFVAKSKGLEKWGADHGLTKHVYKIGVAEDSAEAAVERLNANAVAGHTDWKFVKKKEVEAVDEDALYARLAKRSARSIPPIIPASRARAESSR